MSPARGGPEERGPQGRMGRSRGGTPQNPTSWKGLSTSECFTSSPRSWCWRLPGGGCWVGSEIPLEALQQLNSVGLCLQMQPLTSRQARAPGKTCAKYPGEKEERFIPLHWGPRTRPEAAAPAPARRQRQGRSKTKQPKPSTLRLCSVAPGRSRTFGNTHKAK